MNPRARAYVGIINPNGTRRVVVMFTAHDAASFDLPPRRDLANHAGVFDWGPKTGAPGAQLALAILADFFGPDRVHLAIDHHRQFGDDVIAQLHHDAGFTLTHPVIAKALMIRPRITDATRRDEPEHH